MVIMSVSDPSDFWTCPLKLELQLDNIKKVQALVSNKSRAMQRIHQTKRHAQEFKSRFLSTIMLTVFKLILGCCPILYDDDKQTSYDRVIKFSEKNLL